MVVKETLRLNPPAVGIFPRAARENVEIGGYRVRRGEQVQLLSFITQRDPRWFPEPDALGTAVKAVSSELLALL